MVLLKRGAFKALAYWKARFARAAPLPPLAIPLRAAATSDALVCANY